MTWWIFIVLLIGVVIAARVVQKQRRRRPHARALAQFRQPFRFSAGDPIWYVREPGNKGDFPEIDSAEIVESLDTGYMVKRAQGMTFIRNNRADKLHLRTTEN
jgi:hypothetical protein